ncbi:hypothetical protein B4919_06430 [Francisella tularensis subsp. novicida]|uniref:hypothetical protein n=1 Tax=Francisella tularensis TaxID=263 RepID=UPI000CE29C56|nr:hypothetical protein [Francisella tularensis]AVC44442.1 hypothetical protein B4919_06430 [Francisella tularensis subsp. novicida]
MKVKSIIISLNIIFLLIILSSCREASFLADVAKSTVETHQKSNQAEAVAIEYIHEKYGDIFNSGGAYYKGNGTWGSDFYIDDKTKFCTVRLFLNKDGKFEVIKPGGIFKPDNCGELILRPKITKYIQDNTVNKFYDKSDVSMGVSLSCADKEKNCGLPKGEDIYNSNGYWKLSAKEWLDKFYPYLKVDTIGVSIFNQKKTARDIVKFLDFIMNLNKYLCNLTSTHKINGIRVSMYSVSKETLKKQFNDSSVTIVRYSKDNPKGILYNNIVTFSNGGAAIEYISITKSNRKETENIKETKYYQPVKQLLESK